VSRQKELLLALPEVPALEPVGRENSPLPMEPAPARVSLPPPSVLPQARREALLREGAILAGGIARVWHPMSRHWDLWRPSQGSQEWWELYSQEKA